MTSEESELERELAEALRRKTPPAGFAARVIASLPPTRVSSPGSRIPSVRFRIPGPGSRIPIQWVAAACLALLVAGTTSVMVYRHQQYLERGRVAKEQLMLALRITGSKLQAAEERVQNIGADRQTDRQADRTERRP